MPMFWMKEFLDDSMMCKDVTTTTLMNNIDFVNKFIFLNFVRLKISPEVYKCSNDEEPRGEYNTLSKSRVEGGGHFRVVL